MARLRGDSGDVARFESTGAGLAADTAQHIEAALEAGLTGYTYLQET